jgi:hypothetical protein
LDRSAFIAQLYHLFTGSNFSFFVGLGLTQLMDALLLNAQAGMIVGLGSGVVIAAGLAACGYFGQKAEYRWVYIAGMVFYALDAAVFLGFGIWLSLVFHGYVLYRLYAGLRASMELSKVERQLDGFAPVQVMGK